MGSSPVAITQKGNVVRIQLKIADHYNIPIGNVKKISD